MSWIWRNFLSFICYPFMSVDKYTSLDEYHTRKYVARKRRRNIKKIAKKNTL